MITQTEFAQAFPTRFGAYLQGSTYACIVNAILEDLKPPKDDIRYYLRPPLSGNRFPALDQSLPEDFPMHQLEELVKSAFASREMKVVDDFFIPGTPEYPENLSLFGFAVNQTYIPRMAAAIIASDLEVNGEKIIYINKYAVDPAYQGNGVGKHLFEAVIETAGRVPVVLRTSDEQLHRMYGRASDINVKIGDYYVHGFGFMHKEKFPYFGRLRKRKNPEGKFVGAEDLFYSAAKKAAEIIPTAIPANSSVKNRIR